MSDRRVKKIGAIYPPDQGYCEMQDLPTLFGRFLCWLGFHDFQVIDKTFEFGAGGGIEKIECRRCGVIATRQG